MSACFQLAQVQLHVKMSVFKLAPKTRVKQYQKAHSSLDYLAVLTQFLLFPVARLPSPGNPIAIGTALLGWILQPAAAEPAALRNVNLKAQLPAEKEQLREGEPAPASWCRHLSAAPRS